VSNALKFTERGSVVITTEAIPDRGRVVFRVEDTGCGIAPAALEHVFEPFHESRPSSASGPEGIGLGLAIVKRYVDLLGGELRVRSTVGSGSCFEVEMPCQSMVDAPGVQRHAA
jgi:signal transduction histidine kinase